MKKKILVTAVAGLLAGVATTASAEGPSADKMGINVSLENSIVDTTDQIMVWHGKFFTAPDLAILAGAGLNTYGADADGTDLALQGGIRKYMSTSSFAPFVGGTISYESIESAGDVTTIALVGEFGAEYFFSPQFSVEGSLRAGFSSTDVDTATPLGTVTTTTTRFGTFGSQISANFYF